METTPMSLNPSTQEPAWVHGHAHEPNPIPPDRVSILTIYTPDGSHHHFDLAALQALPATTLEDCYIVSTGHGRSGPFTFTGVKLLTLLQHVLAPDSRWQSADVESIDHFGTRIFAQELYNEASLRPSLLAYALNGEALTHEKGLVRLIVPSETEDALKQVKWVSEIRVVDGG